MRRREWLRAAVMAGGVVVVRQAGAQQQQAPRLPDTSNLFLMDQSAARQVRMPAKPGATPSMPPADRDALEHRIRCQCGCTLDVFTCRTTDFSCQVSPQMHRDIMALVEGGYSAQEILDAFVSVYGERALMAPTKSGFNILAYIVPSIAIGVVGVVLAVVLRRWKHGSDALAPAPVAPVSGTPDELARLEKMVRDDS